MFKRKFWLFLPLHVFFSLTFVVAQQESDLVIDSTYTSKNMDSRTRYLVMHFTGAGMHSSMITLIGETEREVSTHYLINDHPTKLYHSYIYQLVPEEKRAWHAGVSEWDINRFLNYSSIGIEIVNHNGNHFTYNQKQIEQTIKLAKHLIKKHIIEPVNVIGHSDIAPGRKKDPGILFPWKLLYDNGIGAWPDSSTLAAFEQSLAIPSVKIYQQELKKYGYPIDKTDGIMNKRTIDVIQAFQRHFRPQYVDGIMDRETYAILRALLDKYHNYKDL